MKDFEGKVAVVTGAASGIGLAISKHCLQEGMRVVMADCDEVGLETAVANLSTKHPHVLGVLTDVSRRADVAALAAATVDTFGAVHCLFNNAGVGIATPILASTEADWQWALGVNLWSIIYGVQIFAPVMEAQAEPSHIVNTASIAGLISPPGLGIYRTTKHAVVAFSEALYHEMGQKQSPIKISVLCPGMVRTQILTSAVHPEAKVAQERDEAEVERLTKAMVAAMAPEEVAQIVFAALREERFYILTHPERNWQIEQRMKDVLSGRNPTTSVNTQVENSFH